MEKRTNFHLAVWLGKLAFGGSLTSYSSFFLRQCLSVVESNVLNFLLPGMWGARTLMAMTIRVVLPLMLLYIFTLRYFVESITRTGWID